MMFSSPSGLLLKLDLQAEEPFHSAGVQLWSMNKVCVEMDIHCHVQHSWLVAGWQPNCIELYCVFCKISPSFVKYFSLLLVGLPQIYQGYLGVSWRLNCLKSCASEIVWKTGMLFSRYIHHRERVLALHRTPRVTPCASDPCPAPELCQAWAVATALGSLFSAGHVCQLLREGCCFPLL